MCSVMFRALICSHRGQVNDVFFIDNKYVGTVWDKSLQRKIKAQHRKKTNYVYFFLKYSWREKLRKLKCHTSLCLSIHLSVCMSACLLLYLLWNVLFSFVNSFNMSVTRIFTFKYLSLSNFLFLSSHLDLLICACFSFFMSDFCRISFDFCRS